MCARGNTAALFTNPPLNNCAQLFLQNRLWIDSPRAVSQCLLRPTIRKMMRTRTRAPPPCSRKATSNGPGWLSPCEIFCYSDRWTRSRCVCLTAKLLFFVISTFVSFSFATTFEPKLCGYRCTSEYIPSVRCLPQRTDDRRKTFMIDIVVQLTSQQVFSLSADFVCAHVVGGRLLTDESSPRCHVRAEGTSRRNCNSSRRRRWQLLCYRIVSFSLDQLRSSGQIDFWLFWHTPVIVRWSIPHSKSPFVRKRFRTSKNRWATE